MSVDRAQIEELISEWEDANEHGVNDLVVQTGVLLSNFTDVNLDIKHALNGAKTNDGRINGGYVMDIVRELRRRAGEA